MTDKENIQTLITIFHHNKNQFDEKMKGVQENTIWNKWIDLVSFSASKKITLSDAEIILENLVKKQLLIVKRQINKRFYAVIDIPGYAQSKKDLNCYRKIV